MRRTRIRMPVTAFLILISAGNLLVLTGTSKGSLSDVDGLIHEVGYAVGLALWVVFMVYGMVGMATRNGWFEEE